MVGVPAFCQCELLVDAEITDAYPTLVLVLGLFHEGVAGLVPVDALGHKESPSDISLHEEDDELYDVYPVPEEDEAHRGFDGVDVGGACSAVQTQNKLKEEDPAEIVPTNLHRLVMLGVLDDLEHCDEALKENCEHIVGVDVH